MIELRSVEKGKSDNKPIIGLYEINMERKYIDLHLHLDGAVTVKIAKKLAALQGIKLPAENDEELRKLLTVSEKCNDLNEFLRCFEIPLSLMQTSEGISEAVRLISENVMSTGTIYAEIRFAPQLHTSLGMTQEESVNAAIDGMRRSKLKTNLILCCMRGEGNEKENLETLRLAEKYLVDDGGVVAIDLAGAEALFPTEGYEELFRQAYEKRIPFTIHAGEAAGADSVRCAIRFGAKRIGHGVRSTEDAEVLNLIRDKGITLEMCPTSNRLTKAVQDMKDYPFMDYLNSGIKVTINTDDMGIEDITIDDEFRYMEKMFGLTEENRRKVIGYAVDSAFTTDEVKTWLRQEMIQAE